MEPDENPFPLPQDVPIPLQNARKSLYSVIANSSGVRRHMHKILQLIARCISIMEDLKGLIETPPSTFKGIAKLMESVRKLEILLFKFEAAVSEEPLLSGSLDREMMETWGSSRNELYELLKDAYGPKFKPSMNWEKEVEQVSRLDDSLWVSLIAQDMRDKRIDAAHEVEAIAISVLEREQDPSNSTTVIEGVMRDWGMAAGLPIPTVHGSRDHSSFVSSGSPEATQPDVSDGPSSGAIPPSPDFTERPQLAPTTSMSPKDDIDITTSVLQLSPNTKFSTPALPSSFAPWLVPSVEDLLAQFKLEGTLSKTELIGDGVWSTCYKGSLERADNESAPVAIKILRDRNTGEGDGSRDSERRVPLEIIRRESVIAKVARNPNILSFCGYQINDTDTVLVSPWCQNRNLDEYIAKHTDLKDIDKLKLLCDAARGLACLHSLQPRIAHGDIKPQNVIIKDDLTAALHSFELSVVVNEPPSGLESLDGAGTLCYLAPERVLVPGSATNMSDVYAFGGLILTTMSGKHPFHQTLGAGGVTQAIVYGTPKPVDHPNLDEHDPLWNLLSRCWSRRPTDRPSALGLVRTLGDEIRRRSEMEGDTERS